MLAPENTPISKTWPLCRRSGGDGSRSCSRLQRARGLPPEQRVVRRADGELFLCGRSIRRSGASRRTAKERQQDEEGSDEEEERVPEDEIRHFEK